MDFSLTDEQIELVKMVRAFAENELLPKYTYWDQHEKFPQEQWDKMAELGLLGLRVSTKYGGQEMDCLTAGLIAEEISKGDFNCGYMILLNCLIGDILERFATESIKEEWLPKMASGEKKFCIALTEPGSGTDAAALKTKAIKQGDKYILEGEKSAISLLMAADAAVVFAKTDPSARARGISAFLVPLDLPGITRHKYADMGDRPDD